MKILVAKQDLKTALSVVAPSLGSSEGGPAACYLFRRKEGSDDRMEVLSGAGRIYALCPFVAKIEATDWKPEAFTVEGKRLDKWLDAIPDAALTLEVDDEGVVTATIPGLGSQYFQSLDPAEWTYWDKTLEEAKTVTTMPANRLSAALGYSMKFTADAKQESRTPELCVCEVKNGMLSSTDKTTATLITMGDLKDSSLRIHARDVSAIQTFLGTIKGDVEVLEHERGVFFLRGDGACFGEARFHAKFPKFGRPGDEDQHWWDLDVEEVNRAVTFLVAGAAADDKRMHVEYKAGEDTIVLSMRAVANRRASVKVKRVEQGSAEGADPLPEDGFFLSHSGLSRVLTLQEHKCIRFGLNPQGKTGYVRFVDQRFTDEKGEGGDRYLTILAWLRTS